MPETPQQSSLAIHYPWQQPDWDSLQQQINAGKLPHALLINGQRGIGKWHFAKALAYSLLCQSPQSGLACGNCRSCQLNLAESHPDIKLITPEETGKLIKIDQVRQLTDFVTKTAQQGGRKVVLMAPVEALNINAANALLKSLEEPAGDTVMILVCDVISGVMATIRSRCQLLSMRSPKREVALAWLEELHLESGLEQLLDLAAGAPLIAREMAEGDRLHQLGVMIDGLEQVNGGQLPLDSAKQWLELDLPQILEWWLQIVHNALHQQFVIPDKLATIDSSSDKIVANSAQKGQSSDVSRRLDKLYSFSATLNPRWLFRFSDKLLILKQQQLGGANPNKQLLLEELLMDWQALCRQVGRSDR